MAKISVSDQLEEALKGFAAADRAIRAAEQDASGAIESQIADLRDLLEPAKAALIASFAAARTEEIYGAAANGTDSEAGAKLTSSYPDLAASLIDRGYLIAEVADEMDAQTEKHYSAGELDVAETTRGTEEYERGLADYAATLD